MSGRLMPTGKDLARILSDALPEPVVHDGDDYHEFCERGRMEMDRIVVESWREAYRCLFQTRPELARIDREYRIVYSPSVHLCVSRSLYVYGVDKHGFGYNVVGRVLEELLYGRVCEPEPTLVYLCHRCLALLEHSLDHGLDVLDFCDRTVPEILSRLGLLEQALAEESLIRIVWRRWRADEMSYRERRLLRHEIEYPGSMARVLRAEKSAVFNQNIEEQRDRVLRSTLLRLLEKKHGRPVHGLVVPPSLMGRVRRILLHSEAVRRELVALRSWTKDEEERARCSLPRFRPSAHGPPVLVLSENNEPIGPLAAQRLSHAGRAFHSVQHLAVFLILSRIGHPEPYEVVRAVDFRRNEADSAIDARLFRKREAAIRSWIEAKASETVFRKTLMTRDEPVSTPFGRLFDHVLEEKRTELAARTDCRVWSCLSRAGLAPDDLIHARILAFLGFLDRVCVSFRWKKSARTVRNVLRMLGHDGVEATTPSRVQPWHDPRVDAALGGLFRRWRREGSALPSEESLAESLASFAGARPDLGPLLAGVFGTAGDAALSKKALLILRRRGADGAETLARVVHQLVVRGELRRLTGL